MKTEPNKNATLSEAIILGTKIAQECGIRQTTGDVLKFKDGKIDCGCTAGFALIGKYGVDYLEKREAEYKKKANPMWIYDWSVFGKYTTLFQRVFEPKEEVRKKKEQCLLKTVSKTKKQKEAIGRRVNSVYEFIYSLNDGVKMAPKFIADKLKKCGL